MCKRLITKFRAFAGAIATLTVVLCLSVSANAQSTDVGHPTPLTENSIRGTLEKAENNFQGDIASDAGAATAGETRTGTPGGYRTLVIKMKDGSIQEIDLSKIADIIFR